METIGIKTGIENMNFRKVTEMLAKSFWSPGIGMALGFKKISIPEQWMQIRNERPRR